MLEENIVKLILVFLICIILYKIILSRKKVIIENANFEASYLSPIYKKHNIIIDKKRKELKKGNKSIYYKNNFNSKEGDNNCKNKNLTNTILKKHKINVPKSYLWDSSKTNSQNLVKFSKKKLNYPVVVKATKSMQGKHVYTDVYNHNEIIKYIKIIRKNNKSDILIEEQIKGNYYRVTIFNKHIIGILKGIPPFVIGNGYSNVIDLVNKFNDNKKKGEKINSINNNYIKKQMNHKFHSKSVIPKNKKIFITNNINRHNGSGLEEIDIKLVNPISLELFKKINNALKINLSGIDIISSDINDPSKTYVIEVNERPAIDNHYNVNKKHIDKLLNSMFL